MRKLRTREFSMKQEVKRLRKLVGKDDVTVSESKFRRKR